MARVVKNRAEHHAVTLKDDRGREIVLIKGGPRRAYLWVVSSPEHPVVTVSGAVALRTLAYSILREVGFNRPRKTRRS